MNATMTHQPPPFTHCDKVLLFEAILKILQSKNVPSKISKFRSPLPPNIQLIYYSFTSDVSLVNLFSVKKIYKELQKEKEEAQ